MSGDRSKPLHSDFFRLWPERFPFVHMFMDAVFPWLCWFVGFCTGVAWVVGQAL